MNSDPAAPFIRGELVNESICFPPALVRLRDQRLREIEAELADDAAARALRIPQEIFALRAKVMERLLEKLDLLEDFKALHAAENEGNYPVDVA